MDEHAILSGYASSADGSAFDELVRRYEPLVRSAALRQVRDPQLAGDITQTAMLTLLRKAGTIRRKQPVGPWLLRVTHYLAIDALRSNSVRRHHEGLAARQRGECWEADSNSPWPSIAPILDSALHALSNDDRTILTLRYLQDWSTEQIAAELHVTSTSVRQRLSRALRRLRKVLTERGVQRDDLMPVLPPLLLRCKQWIGGSWNLLPGKGATAAIAAMIILGGGLMLSRAAMRKTPAVTPILSRAEVTQPINLRAKSTLP